MSEKPLEDIALATLPLGEAERPVRMLIIEDDPGVGMAMEEYFRQQGYAVTRAMDGETGLKLMQQKPGFDIITLDVTLPGKNGFDVLRESQALGITAPVLMVTARGEQENILKGLGLGASDYIVKPFDPDDLQDHVETILGLATELTESLATYRIGEITFDFEAHRAYQDDQEIPLSELALDFLQYMIEHRGQIVTRKRLLRDVWGINQDHVSFTVSPEVVTQQVEKHVETIRQLIEPIPEAPHHLETVYGLGYRFNA